MQAAKLDHVAFANQYIDDVLTSKFPACKWIKAACQRQLDDLDRQDTEDFPYIFDEQAANKVCNFISNMPHIKGEWATRNELFVLHDSQQFRLTTIFGWIHRDTGYRRFRQVYISVARKNGKSFETAAVANYMMTEDGEQGPEIYSAATTVKQAEIVFKSSRSMARRALGFARHYGVQIHMRAMTIDETDASYTTLSSDADTLDGLNPHFASLDELHAQKRGSYDVLESALGSRAQPLLWLITTSGFDRSSVCFEIQTYLQRILNTTLHKHQGLGYKVTGTSVTDETFFGVIYTIDEDDDFTDESIWQKANPLIDVSVKRDDLSRMCRKAQEMTSALNNFLTKRLNVWVNAATAWMDMVKYDACADASLDIDDFEGETCIAGLDLASRWDLAAKVIIFRREIRGEHHYYLFPQFYLPEETVDTSSNSQYRGWERQGHILQTSGTIIDFDEIEEDLREDSLLCDLHQVGVDPHQATKVITDLSKEGFDIVEVTPMVQNFSEPMKELEALVLAKRLHHDGNPVLAWCIANTDCKPDRKGGIYPRKANEDENLKIDGLVATLIAMNLWMRYGGTEESVYEKRGIRKL